MVYIISDEISAYEQFLNIRNNEDPEWHNPDNKFAGWKNLHLHARGKLALLMAVERLQKLCHVRHSKAKNCEHDIIINTHKIEGKSASLSATKTFIINQIRPRQDWERMIFCFICPNSSRYYWATKHDIEENIASGNITPQHGGSKEKGHIYMLNIKKGQMPHWFRNLDTWNDIETTEIHLKTQKYKLTIG